MKQKNLVLVAIAVGCGLVAAILTANMGARQKKPSEMVLVPCAAKDLPVGTKLTKEKLQEFVTTREFPKEQAPQMYVQTIEELTDKQMTRTLRVGDTFNPADITTNGFLNPPENHSVMTVRAGIDEAVAGFIGPGAHVDVIASVQLKKSQKWLVFPLFTNMLVLAVDSNAAQAPNGGAYANLSMVSFAVDKETSLLMQAAVTRGASMRLALRHPDKPVIYTDAPTPDQIWDILTDKVEDEKKGDGTSETEMSPKIPMVKVKVPTADLVAGTELNDAVLSSKFKDQEYPEAYVPEGAVTDFKPYLGKYLTKDINANFFVPKSSIGDKPVEQKKVAPTDLAQSPKQGPEEPKKEPVKPKPKPVYQDVTVRTANGVKKYRYQKLENGEFLPLGEVPNNIPTLPEETKPEVNANEPKEEKSEGKTPAAEPETAPQEKTQPTQPGRVLGV